MVQVLDLVWLLHLEQLAKNPEVSEVLDGVRLDVSLELLRDLLISIQMGEVHQLGDGPPHAFDSAHGVLVVHVRLPFGAFHPCGSGTTLDVLLVGISPEEHGEVNQLLLLQLQGEAIDA